MMHAVMHGNTDRGINNNRTTGTGASFQLFLGGQNFF